MPGSHGHRSSRRCMISRAQARGTHFAPHEALPGTNIVRKRFSCIEHFSESERPLCQPLRDLPDCRSRSGTFTHDLSRKVRPRRTATNQQGETEHRSLPVQKSQFPGQENPSPTSSFSESTDTANRPLRAGFCCPCCSLLIETRRRFKDGQRWGVFIGHSF